MTTWVILPRCKLMISVSELLECWAASYGSNDVKQLPSAPGRRIKLIASNCLGEGANCAVGGAGWRESCKNIFVWFTWNTWTTWTTWNTRALCYIVHA